MPRGETPQAESVIKLESRRCFSTRLLAKCMRMRVISWSNGRVRAANAGAKRLPGSTRTARVSA